MLDINRRHFLKVVASAGAAVTVSTALGGCSSLVRADNADTVDFTHGVASGDPTTNALMLWTRAVPKNNAKPVITLGWEVARDPSFSDIIRSGTATTSARRDYTVKVDVQQLPAGMSLYYRFVGHDQYSPIGEGATLPQQGIDSIRLGVFSCSNYPAGFFNPYHHASQDDTIDFVLHLGDYIYEYGAGGYGYDDAERIGRTFPDNNNKEIVSLDDYRRRYALYRTDEGLKALHATKSFIVVWDDHEIANDTYKDGAQNHQPDTEGDFYQRRAAAIQAYYEWMPIRPPQGDASLQIYRSFELGDLANLIMLDTRIIGRDKQLAYADFTDASTGEFDSQGFQAAMQSDRSILGKKQLQWLVNQLAQSNARWQILGQQLLMARMNFPAAIIGSKDRSTIANKLLKAAQLKQARANGQQLTEQQQRYIDTVTPYNLDAWDGYAMEREVLFQQVKQMGKKIVVLAGDTHNAWHNHLTTHTGEQIGVEFGTSSVSSPGMETYLGLDDATAKKLAQALPTVIKDLQYTNLHERGYMVTQISKDAIDNEWRFVDTIKSKDYQLSGTHRAQFRG
ncbi:alkaline phosphatase D family protein [Idiomarina baltica]|uniref:Phosphodiesterase/alkaline phosphatase D n=1 Tax=Idiomarina baltica OS145 TaxID=314276 RepID=A0ABM9WLI8_9GAMM|nr:alkaline phosphatase D family protein [Idiomarina baltica]EAQ31725.1 Phosphodiesterase/alkaline phosphatase D [Idiomarina baltica OS145]